MSDFVRNTHNAIWTCDFCVQHTVRFTALYIFVIMELGSRKVVHINVTEHPSQAWVQRQVRDAAFDGTPKFLLHDNDGIFGQLGKPVTREVVGKKVSCRSSFDVWLAEAMSWWYVAPCPGDGAKARLRHSRLLWWRNLLKSNKKIGGGTTRGNEKS